MMARIRTVKPEFWLNEQLAGLDCHARLLAIALLNQCDDGGYFRANVALVRSSCMPFDDDAEHVRRSLNALAAIGYIEIRRTDAGKEIGRVCKFLDHQKIDKAQESKFAADFQDCWSEDSERGDASPIDRRSIDDASPNDPGTIDDQSAIVRRLEQGTGKGNREAEKEQGSGNGTVEQSGTASAESQNAPGLLIPKKAPAGRTAGRPTLDEVAAECRERGNSVDPESFWAHYEANGWKQGNGNPIKSWRAAVVTWEKNASRFDGRGSTENRARAGSGPVTFAQQRLENTRQAIEEFCDHE